MGSYLALHSAAARGPSAVHYLYVRQLESYHYNRFNVVMVHLKMRRGDVRTYKDLTIALPDPGDWTLANVLRRQAVTRPHAIYLDAPEEQRCWTYAEVLERAENVGSTLLDAGLSYGDRVL